MRSFRQFLGLPRRAVIATLANLLRDEVRTVPRNLILVRHGESEENVLTRRIKELSRTKGVELDEEALLAELGLGSRPHTSRIRLTERGCDQARAARDWIHAHLPELDEAVKFHSSYVRAVETAGLLDLLGAWKEDYSLGERDWGWMDRVPLSDYFRIREDMKATPFYFAPIHGETFRDLVLRIKRFIDTLARNYSNRDVVVVCHGEVMWAFRFVLERMTVERFEELEHSSNPHDRIHNCQIIQYSRIDPVTQEVGRRYDHMRSVCPWDETLSSNEWRPIERITRNTKDLLTYAEQYPHIL